MPVTAVTTDPEALTMTLTARFAASVPRLWQAFTDPRQLERFWGPPGWPATFASFDFAVGGTARYAMVGADGETARGSWEFLHIDQPHRFEVVDSFVDAEGVPLDGMPSMRMTFTFEAEGDASTLTNVTHFASLEGLEQVVAMGAVDGATQAMNQLDAVLQGLRSYAQGQGTRTELLDDTHVRITRLIDGSADLVWRAHTEPDLMRRWLTGPEGWQMTVCELDPAAGGAYRYAWEHETQAAPGFGFDGHAVLVDAPRRMVSTEHMTGTDFPATTNDLTLVEEDGVTLITLIITYPDRQTRDMVLATGMTDGMETSYQRLDGMLPALT